MAGRSPFHAGEQAVQERLGVRDVDTWARRVVRPYMPEEHRAFFMAQPFVVVAARDAEGRPWVTLLCGQPGFITAPDPRELRIDAKLAEGDALERALARARRVDVGVLGIELATRRRNRVNGEARGGPGGTLSLRVEQCFGNCPQYIHARAWRWVDDSRPGAVTRGTRLSADQRLRVEGADTFFVGSGYRGAGDRAAYGMDASHRGGEPGFVRVEGPRRLMFPDYAGNNHFNTIGNLVMDPRVGLTFVDFARGGLLQVSGRATVDWDSPEIARFPGARRLVRVEIDAVVDLPSALPLRWTGAGQAARSLRVVDRIKESADVTSFVFAAVDGGPLAAFEAGQHLPLELAIPGLERRVVRTYSLSSGPSDPRYRITVKRQLGGLVSGYLHDHVGPGDVVSARAPAGDFTLTDEDVPVVLVSAGVGVTPMVSMLHSLLDDPARRGPVWFVHGARDGLHHPLDAEVSARIADDPRARRYVVYSRPLATDRGHDDVGRLDGSRLAGLVSGPRALFYVCGPTGFMAAIREALEVHGIAPERVRTETFGPASGGAGPSLRSGADP